MILFFLILALLIAILAVVFALQNLEIITVSFFGNSLEGSMALILLVTFVVGVVVGVLLLLPYYIRKAVRVRRLGRSLAELNRKKTGDDNDNDDDNDDFDEV